MLYKQKVFLLAWFGKKNLTQKRGRQQSGAKKAADF